MTNSNAATILELKAVQATMELAADRAVMQAAIDELEAA